MEVVEVVVEEEEEAKGEEDDRGGPRPTGVACLKGSREEEEDFFFSDSGSSPSSRRCSSVKPSNSLEGDEVVAAPRQHRLRVKSRIATARRKCLVYLRQTPTALFNASSSPFHSHTCSKMCRARF